MNSNNESFNQNCEEQNIKEIISKNLLDLRQSHHYTQSELASLLHYSDKAVSRWEKGEVCPDIETLNNIANVYNIDLCYLFKNHENERTDEEIKKEEKIKATVDITKILMTCIGVLVVYSIAVFIFVYLQIFKNIIYFQIFVEGVPVSALYVLYQNHKLFKSNLIRFLTLSIFNWSLITAVYLAFIENNMWPIFFLGIPIQAIMVLGYWLKLKKQL